MTRLDDSMYFFLLLREEIMRTGMMISEPGLLKGAYSIKLKKGVIYFKSIYAVHRL